MFLVRLHHHHLLDLHLHLLLLFLLPLLYLLHLHPLLLFHLRLHHHHHHHYHHHHHHHHHFRNGWQTPGPPPHTSANRPSPLTWVAYRSSVRIALNLLTPPGLPSQKNIRPWPLSSPPGSSGLLPLHSAQWKSWWMTDYRDTPCIHAIWFI